MRVAIVLFGQPRNYREGHRQIQAWCLRHPTCTFEYYYHCWTLPHGTSFRMSPYALVDPSHLYYHEDTPQQLEALYHPILCEYTDQSTFVHTIGHTFVQNEKNIFDQIYSRTQARHLLAQSGRSYDRVMMTRFDINTPIHLDVFDKHVYIQSKHLPRRIFSDHTVMTTHPVFMLWFDLYDRILDFHQDPDLKAKVESYGEKMKLNAEEILFAAYLYHFKNLDQIQYFDGGYRIDFGSRRRYSLREQSTSFMTRIRRIF